MKQPETPLPPKSINVILFENDYEIKFPTNGQLIDIEALKIRLSKDAQQSIGNQNTTASNIVYITIEAIATFSILIPSLQLGKDLGKSLMDLTPMETKPLLKAYTKQYFPWFDQWMQIINTEEKVDE